MEVQVEHLKLSKSILIAAQVQSLQLVVKGKPSKLLMIPIALLGGVWQDTLYRRSPIQVKKWGRFKLSITLVNPRNGPRPKWTQRENERY